VTLPSWGVLGIGVLGELTPGVGPGPEEEDTTVALGLTYYAMRKLLDAKLPYMSGWTMGLYALVTAWSPTRSASDYTAAPQVPTFDGYMVKPLGPWPFSILTAQNEVQVNAPLVVWTITGLSHPGPVAGFYVLDALGQLVGAQANPAGVVIVGGTVQPFSVAPIFKEQQIA
jgi:hypothetical protein